jgi:hypothetical protein
MIFNFGILKHMCKSERAKSLAREFGLKMVGFGEALGSINSYFKAGAGLANESTTAIQYFSKLTGTSIGTSGAALELYNAGEALVCKDSLCFGLSCIGLTADVITAATSFLTGVNATSTFIIPVSLFCNVLVYNCKHGNLFKHCGGN